MSGNSPSIKNVMKGIVPITRFNSDEAVRIFDEVNQTGVRVVMRGDTPVAVLVAPDLYETMIEMLEDYVLYIEAESRMKGTDMQDWISQDEVLRDLEISQEELDDVQVEID